MKFSRSSSIPIAKVGREHRAWQSKLALEHKSTLVSIERSVKEGLVEQQKAQEMLQTRDWMEGDRTHKRKEESSPLLYAGSTNAEDPFERFPRMLKDGTVQGFRRGYYAPWTRSSFELTQHLTPTDNKSVRQLIKERSYRKAFRDQQERARKLSTEQNSPVRRVQKSQSGADSGGKASPTAHLKLPSINKQLF